MADFKESTFVVTGGTGFVGSHVVNVLRKRGVAEENIFIPRSSDYDLREFSHCARVVAGKDYVIHLAAISGGFEFHRQNPGSIFYDNIMINLQLLEASRRAGVRKFVGIGSATEYPNNAPMPLREETLWDGYPSRVHAPYALAKKMMLVQGQTYHVQYGFCALHLMPTNMYGPGERLDSPYVIPALTRKILSAKNSHTPTLESPGDGLATRDFLYVEDAAEAIVRATEVYDKPDPVNLGSGQEITLESVSKRLAKLIGFEGEVIWENMHVGIDKRRVLDVSRARDAFGFKPGVSFDEGIEKTVKWYLSKI